jgi:GTPase KRas protein
VQNVFAEEYDPTIEDSYRKQVVVNDQVCLLDILDTAGREDYSAMHEQWIRTGDAFYIIYSITNRQSFVMASEWRNRILKVKDDAKFSCILVGNKADLDAQREVTTVEAEELAKSWNCPFFETSAKTDTNIAQAFNQLVTLVQRASPMEYIPRKKKKVGLWKRIKSLLAH